MKRFDLVSLETAFEFFVVFFLGGGRLLSNLNFGSLPSFSPSGFIGSDQVSTCELVKWRGFRNNSVFTIEAKCYIVVPRGHSIATGFDLPSFWFLPSFIVIDRFFYCLLFMATPPISILSSLKKN